MSNRPEQMIKEELTYDEAKEKLLLIFHKTRTTENLWVPPDVVHGILYGKVYGHG